jgi:hypothetical protein
MGPRGGVRAVGRPWLQAKGVARLGGANGGATVSSGRRRGAHARGKLDGLK